MVSPERALQAADHKYSGTGRFVSHTVSAPVLNSERGQFCIRMRHSRYEPPITFQRS